MIEEIGEIARWANRCGARRLLCVALGAALASLLLVSTAGAFRQRGFDYNSAASFGGSGSGPGQMLEPAGVAVNQVTGEIYVMDAGNNRVDAFNAAHEFQRAWGVGVINGSNEFQVCTTTTGCVKGKAGRKKGQLHGAGAIAVDSNPTSPSFGDVYVEIKPYEEEIGNKEVELEFGLIEKYNGSTGAPITVIRGWKAKGESLERFEEPHGIAVGEKGELFVYNESEEIFEFNNAPSNEYVRTLEYEVEGEPADGLAAAGGGVLYIAHSEPPLKLFEVTPTQFGKYKIGFEDEEAEEEHAPQVLLPLSTGVIPEASTGIAVSPATQNALVDTGTQVAIVNEAGEEVQRLGAGSESGALQKSTAVAANNKSKEILAADAGTNKIAVFSAEQAGPPRIEEANRKITNATSADLTATIAPGGQPSTDWFRYSTEPVPPASQPCNLPCVEVPLPHASLAEGAEEGFADVVASPVEVEGLTPRTVYHFIAFAANASGTSESAERTFRTPAPVLGEGLPDGRHWELVSPAKGKNGASIETQSREGGLIQAAADGHAITYIATTAFEGAEGNRAPEPNQILSVRHDTGSASSWATKDINTPNGEPTGIAAGAPVAYQWFTANLEEALVIPRSVVRLTPAEASETTAYKRRNFEGCEETVEEGCYTALVNDTNVTSGKPYGGVLQPAPYMTPSGEHIVLESKGPLTSEPAAGSNLYEWTAGTLKLINALSNGTPLEEPRLGASGSPTSKVVRNALSSDGTRAIFTAAGHLYERNMSTGKTLQVDKSQEGVAEGSSIPQYQTASEDGKTIFFTDTSKLTTKANPLSHPDLYVCEVEEGEGGPACKLSDLTTETHPGEPADVQGDVPGAASDGSNVYFVANGALAGGATHGSCRNHLNEETEEEEIQLSNMCSLYVDHRTGPGAWAPPQLIATLSNADEPDWAVGANKDLGIMTSRVSPSGKWFAFMSDRRLPTSTNPAGYDNRDANSGKPDEEVFLFNATTSKLVCASCDPTGARPVGVKDVPQSEEGVGIVVDRPEVWKDRWLAANVPGWTKLGVATSFYQSRYLLDNGRLFFNSPQSLVPQDENGTKQDVYEYEPAGIAGPDSLAQCTSESDTYGEGSLGCVSLISSGRDSHESAFLDASESGNDVFFATAGALAPADTDHNFDVYDAAVCGQPGTASCVPPPEGSPTPCAGEECREGGAEPGGTGGAPASKVSGSNSTRHEVLGSTEEKKTTKPVVKPLTRAQKYAKALKACKKIKNKHKRSQCMAQAKKKYGPPAKKHGKAKKGSVKR